jgi:hypothetical protein
VPDSIKVFLSHKQEDSALAATIALRLRANQLDVYLDVIDINLGKSGPDLADYLRAEMSKCSQLLAVISAQTRQSQWVPWEIGVATEKEYPLASYIDQVPAPEFLRKWPYLRSLADVDKYAAESKKTRRTMTLDQLTVTESIAQQRAFRNFYSSLRASLGQYD